MMFLLNAAAALSVVSSVYAQSNGTVHQVKVGGVLSAKQNIYMFDPANTQANVGDVVQFMFTGIPANHSITQSSFASPCTREDGGFDSGWVAAPTDHNGSLPPATWNLTVTNASHPIWFYCKQTVPQFHCSSGMVGAINGPTSGANSMDNFIKNAQGAGAPDQGVGGLVGQGASASALPGPITGDLQYFGTPISGVASATGGGSGTSGGANPTSTTGNGAVSARYSIPILTLVTIAMGFALA